MPDDMVLVHEGVYRERVAPARGGLKGKPIIYMADNGEKVVIKGSDTWTPDWQKWKGVKDARKRTPILNQKL